MKSSEIDVSTNKNHKGLPEAMYQYLSTNTKVPILKYHMKQPVANKQMWLDHMFCKSTNTNVPILKYQYKSTNTKVPIQKYQY